MLVFDISDFSKNAAKVFDAALTEEVIINNKDGKCFKILPINNENESASSGSGGKSPFDDIPCIVAGITTQEIVDLIKESRAGV